MIRAFLIVLALAMPCQANDYDAEAALALTAASIQESKPVVIQPVTFQGHTHTCANGHTWDHTMDNGSHKCPSCGLMQFNVDTIRTISSGCESGNCPTYTPQRRGFFRR